MGKTRDATGEKPCYNESIKKSANIVFSRWGQPSKAVPSPCFMGENQKGQRGGENMPTPKQEAYCQNRAIKKMSQREAYLNAYPTSKNWKPKTVDEAACRLEKDCKISARLKELTQQESDRIAAEAAWTRQDAFKELTRLISRANEEIDARRVLTPPTVSAILNAVKELNSIYEVGKKSEGEGMIDDILNAVKGVDDD